MDKNTKNIANQYGYAVFIAKKLGDTTAQYVRNVVYRHNNGARFYGSKAKKIIRQYLKIANQNN